jgi:hypothetical protein
MLVYRFQIPDPARPLAGGPDWGPSGELIDFIPAPLVGSDIVGRRIDGLSSHIGTYGMGGVGFFGLRLGSQWLVIALRGAGAWMRADGRMIEDMFWSDRSRARPWMLEGESEWLSQRIIGRTISRARIERHALRIELDDAFALSIESDASLRPPFEGDSTPRAFGVDDDLRRAVFLSPTDELWI